MASAAVMTGDSDVVVQLVRDIPSLLWFVLAVIVLVVFRPQIAALLSTLRSLKLPGGIEAQFQTAVVSAAASKHTEVAAPEVSRLARRAARDQDVIRGAAILWVDDNPASTTGERAALAALGVRVDTAISTEEGLQRLAGDGFDLVISDIRRGDDATAGLTFAKEVRDRTGLPIIFYTGTVDRDKPVPIGATGITDRPDELLHLVMDALVRRRG